MVGCSFKSFFNQRAQLHVHVSRVHVPLETIYLDRYYVVPRHIHVAVHIKKTYGPKHT